MLRAWFLAVLICLGFLAVTRGTVQGVPDAAYAAVDAASVLADSPSSGETPGRHVSATPPIVCPAASTWASQGHHAVLARALCHSMARAPRSPDASSSSFPLALRPQFQTPLLI